MTRWHRRTSYPTSCQGSGIWGLSGRATAREFGQGGPVRQRNPARRDGALDGTDRPRIVATGSGAVDCTRPRKLLVDQRRLRSRSNDRGSSARDRADRDESESRYA